MGSSSTPYGQRLLPQALDEHSRHDPSRVYASIARSIDLAQGFRDVTMREMASAVDSIAWWLESRIRKSKKFETLAYMGVSDLRYPIFCLAGMKCGWQVLLLSPHNSVVQNRSLLDRTSCSLVFHTTELIDKISLLQGEESELLTKTVQPLDEILTNQSPPYPYYKTFAEARNDPALILHSSGSTGNPKLIKMTHGTFSVTDNDRNMPVPPGRRAQNGAQFNFEAGGRFFSCFPPYHLAGTQATLILPIFSTSATVVLGHPSVPPSGHLMIEIIRQQRQLIKAFYVPPSILEQWARDPEGMSQAEQLNFVLYGGGPLAPDVGNSLSNVTDVCQMYGSAEAGQIQLLVPQKGEWAYMEWNPYEEVDMQPTDEGVYEMVLHQDPRFSRHRSLSHTFPDVKTWRTGDLFKPHPTKPGLWQFFARTDDVVVLSNGHKVHPSAFESALSEHPWLSGAIVIGSGRTRPALLLELSSTVPTGERAEALEKIWPIVEQANEKAPVHAKVSRSMIVFSDQQRPFFRAPKGTIVRRLTIQEYSKEIDHLYDEESINHESPVLGNLSFADMKRFLLDCILSIQPDAHLSDHTDLFELGFNSEKVAELVTKIRQGTSRYVKSSTSPITMSLIYSHTNILELAHSIQSNLESSSEIAPNTKNRPQLEDLVDKYTHNLPLPRSGKSKKFSIMLTGSTGSLGSTLLPLLLMKPKVSRVYCLTRSTISVESYISSWAGSELPQETILQKLKYIQADFSKAYLGLNDRTYADLLANVNVIIHLAWDVNFNRPLQSYESPHLSNLRSLIDFSATSSHRAKIVFASSTSYAIAWASTYNKATIPEAIIFPPGAVSDTGYGASKQAAERILALASDRSKIPVDILRVGQIAGPRDARSKAVWSKQEWIPSLVVTSKALGFIPDVHVPIDWIPIDELAQIIIEIALGERPAANGINKSAADGDHLRIYNCVNPTPSPWTALTSVLHRILPRAKLVPLQEWVEILETYEPSEKHLRDMPALKLMAFFHALVKYQQTSANPAFAVNNSMQASRTMATLSAIDEPVLEQWIEQLI